MAKKEGKINLTESLQKLNEIVEWFEGEEDIDVEVGLDKVKEAAELIKSSKGRLAEIDTEFKEIEKEISEDVPEDEDDEDDEWDNTEEEGENGDVNPDDIPF